jgi:transcriptional regulator with GAF, ATPase, and Fis domain/tetratricopeptide (TPR) repeat protein
MQNGAGGMLTPDGPSGSALPGTRTPDAEAATPAARAGDPRPPALEPGADAGPGLCIGRERELERLDELYREAGREGERLALVDGPRGVGKGQILRALASRVRLAGGVVLEGRCEHGRAFGPFGEIVERALRFLDEIDHRTAIDLRALACRGECHRFWYQHAGDEPRGRDEGGPARRLFAGSRVDELALEERLRFFDAVHGLLQDVARVRPPVVLIHGLERSDDGTLELLRFLLDGAGPASHGVETGRALQALFVATRHTDLGADLDRPAHRAVAGHRSARRVEVATLDAQGVRQYLQTSSSVARVLARTGGVPERIDLLLESEPLTPEAALARRLDALSPGARRLVDALAVIGQPAEIELVAAVAEDPGEAGAGGDREARGVFSRFDLLARNIVDGALVFRFEREADRERTYSLLPPEARAALHRRAVAAFAQGPTPRPEAAVRHALLAGDARGALPHLEDAARSLEARYAHSEAAALIEGALAEVPEAERPVALRDHLVDLYRVLGDYRRALGHARSLTDADPACPRAALRLGMLLTLAGRLPEGVDALGRARELAADAGDAEAVWEVEALLAEAHYQRGDYGTARRWAEGALAAADGDALLLELHARNTLGKLHLAQKDLRRAAALFDENRFKAGKAGLARQEAQALTNFGVALLRQQHLDGAERAFEEAIAIAERAHDTRERAIATENLAVLAHLRRDYTQAQVLYHQAVALLKRLGNRSMLARVAYNLGQLYLRLGERDRARTLCDFAAHVGGTSLPPAVAGEGMFLRGRLEAACGDTRAAKTAFLRAKDVFHEMQESWEVDANLELARLHLADGEVDQAAAILDALPEGHPPKRAAELALLQVELERATGRPTLAPARRAVAATDEVDDPELQLPAQLRLSRALLDADDLAGASLALERAQHLETEMTSRVPADALAAWSARPARAELAFVEGRVAAAWNQRPEGAGVLSASQRSPRPATTASIPAPPAAAEATSAAPALDADDRWARWRARFPRIVGRSDGLAQVLTLVDKVAPSGATVLLRGESGTGKELVADAVHRASPRVDQPFVKVNCAALVETLLLSELFGHERGAFTGAQARRKGRFELADGGTIFLDEIGDISPKTQVALLRVLQEREFERVGGTQPIKVDVRIVAATNRDLEGMVQAGSFREDLYYRLRGVVIDLPALRERPRDIAPLTEGLLRRIAEERGEPVRSVSPEALALLERHRWPGNVRELENVLRSATLFADGPVLQEGDFRAFSDLFDDPRGAPEAPSDLSQTAKGDAGAAAEGKVRPLDEASSARSNSVGTPPLEHPPVAPVEERVYDRVRSGDHSLFEMKKMLERECIVRALQETGGNITQAAGLLGMKRPRLSQLVKQYGLNESPGDAS